MLTGRIFDIKRYAVKDGPGIRTTVFFMGCPLSCLWCHNPEGQRMSAKTIKRERRLGEYCQTIEEEIATDYTVDGLLVELMKDSVFFEESGGGVTFSGGEPLMQSDFLAACLTECRRRGIHTAIDTSGYAPLGVIEKVIELTDLFLFDIKQLDERQHKVQVGVELAPVLRNLDRVVAAGKPVIIRYPMIPGLNDSKVHFQAIAVLMKEKDLKEIHILPYHKIGDSKYDRLGMSNPLEGITPPTKEQITIVQNFFANKGCIVKIGG